MMFCPWILCFDLRLVPTAVHRFESHQTWRFLAKCDAKGQGARAQNFALSYHKSDIKIFPCYCISIYIYISKTEQVWVEIS